MSKLTLAERVKNYLEKSGDKEVFTTADNNLFRLARDARRHASTLDDKKVVRHDASTGKAREVKGKESDEQIAVADLTLDQLADRLKDVNDPAAVNAALEAEQDAEDTRKGAIELLEDKLKELAEEEE